MALDSATPKPRDPRSLRTSVKDIDKQMDELLGATSADLAEEIERLEAAHEVLHQALKND